MRMIDDDTVAKMVSGEFDYFKTQMAPRRRMFFDCLMHYLGKPQGRKNPTMSNIVLPHAAEAVDVFVAEWLNSMFGPDGMNIDLVGRTLIDENQARAIRNMIKFQLYHAASKEKYRKIVTSAGIYGAGIIKTHLCKDYQKMPVDKPIMINVMGMQLELGMERTIEDTLVYMGPTISHVDVFDFFPHPAMVDINDPLPVIQRVHLTEEDLVDGLEGGYYEPKAVDKLLSKIVAYRKDGSGAVDGQADFGLEGGDDDDYKERRRRYAGIQGGVSEAGVLCYERQGPYDIDDDGRSENCVFLVGPDNTALRAEELPYFDGKKTYCMMEMFDRPGEFWPIGIIEKAHSGLHVTDSIMNHALTHMRKSLYPATIIDSQVKDAELLGMPGGLLHIDNVQEGRSLDSYIRQLYPQQLSSDVFSLYEYSRESVQQATGIADIRAGRLTNAKQTARAVTIATQNASSKAQAVFEMTESTGIIPVCRKFHMMNRQFVNKEYAIQVIGKDGLWWPDSVNPRDIAADVDFISLGSSRELNRQSRVENLERLFGLIANTPFAQPFMTPIIMELLKGLKFDNLEELEQTMNAEMIKQQEYQQYLMSLGQYPTVAGNRPQMPGRDQPPMIAQGMTSDTGEENKAVAV